MSSFYIHTRRQTKGPISESEARALHDACLLSPDAMASDDGTRWIPMHVMFPHWFSAPEDTREAPLSGATGPQSINPYQSPVHGGTMLPKDAEFPMKPPGIRRLRYALILLGIMIGAILLAYLLDMVEIASPAGNLFLGICLLFPTFSRLRNIGESTAWSLLMLVPFASLYIVVRCLILPPNYGYEGGKLDRPAKIILSVVGLVVIFILGLLWNSRYGTGPSIKKSPEALRPRGWEK